LLHRTKEGPGGEGGGKGEKNRQLKRKQFEKRPHFLSKKMVPKPGTIGLGGGQQRCRENGGKKGQGAKRRRKHPKSM